MMETADWRHICVDMQRMFAEDTPWHVPWMQRVKDQVVEIAARHAKQTTFTRFVPPKTAADRRGAWQTYYEKWWMMTRDHLPDELVDVVPELRRLVPPAGIFDKASYSPWLDGRLDAELRREKVTSLVISGGETDVCVLATVLGAIDLGYRVTVIEDAVCSGADETHDASLKVLGERFSVQLELVSTEAFLAGSRVF